MKDGWGKDIEGYNQNLDDKEQEAEGQKIDPLPADFNDPAEEADKSKQPTQEDDLSSLQSALEAARRLEKSKSGKIPPTETDVATANALGFDLDCVALHEIEQLKGEIKAEIKQMQSKQK